MATTQGVEGSGLAGADGEAASPEAERPLRADARRNRERLLTAARTVFAQAGDTASMEAIAREAGVGVGTLYRHFPTRIDLVEAVYRDDVEELSEAAHRAVSELEPWPAVEAFLDAFTRYAQTKRTLLSELHQAFEKNPSLKSGAKEIIDASFTLVIDRAKRAGAIRADIEGADVPQLLGPLCTNATITPEQYRRLVRTILDGLRVPAAESGAGG